jgi:hypothetical protein
MNQELIEKILAFMRSSEIAWLKVRSGFAVAAFSSVDKLSASCKITKTTSNSAR